MVKLSDLAGARDYLDANVIIYTVERLGPFTPAHGALFAKADAGALSLLTSELTLAECLSKPFADGNQRRVDAYLTFLNGRPSLPLCAVDRATLIAAARLRATLNAKLADAIHAASAVNAGCTHFLTNDFRVRSPMGISPIRWDDLHP